MNEKIVSIGGGTGLSILLRAIRDISDNITAIVNVVDDGGGSGVLREDLSMLPPGDIRNCILALADKEPVLQELFAYRFKEGINKNQAFGNLMIAAMLGISDNFEDAVTKVSDIFAIKGVVLPATNEDVRLGAVLEDGTNVVGESNIPYNVLKKNSKINNVYLIPSNISAIKKSTDAITEADYIIIGPGSLYTSVIPNLLVDDIKISINSSKAIKIYVSNLMTQPGETDNYYIYEHLKAIKEHSGVNFDYIIVNDEDVSAEIKDRYSKEKSDLLVLKNEDKKYFDEHNIKIIQSGIIEVKKGYIRHDIKKMKEIITNIISTN